MKSFFPFIAIIGFLGLLTFCKPVEEITTNDRVLLAFEFDTINFDTVFTDQVSITRKLKVYNTSKNAISISSIRLAGMSNSFYSLIINGIKSNQVNDMFLRGKDSLFILATVTLNKTNASLSFLVTDSILFLTNSNEQKVYLVSYGRNASYYNGDTIKTNTTWDSTTARFIKKTVFVAEGATLTLEKGTQLYFVKNSGLKIAGSLVVKGDSNKKVTFQGPRLDEYYKNLPGLWNGLEFLPSSQNNYIDYAVIKNATTGILIGDTSNVISSTIQLSNTVIKNMSNSGLIAFNTNLTAWNCLVYNCAYNGFLLSEKGNYSCYNNTFAFIYSDFTRFGSVVEVKSGSRHLEFINNIFWGENYSESELKCLKSSNDIIKKNLIKLETTSETSDTSNFWNINPLFKDPNNRDGEKLNFRLDSLSPIIQKGILLPYFNNDLDGKKRNLKWDIGAYQFK